MRSGVNTYWASSPVISRYPNNPILTAESVPFPSLLTFNAGVTKFLGKYVMVFRNDYGDAQNKTIQGTNLGLAFSDNGISWEVQSKPCLEISDEDILWINDPRLTVIDSRCYLTYAIIARSGVRGGIAVTDDFEYFEICHTSLPDNRNLVLFPERIDNKYVRLDRPFAGYLRTDPGRYDIWMSNSPDLEYWGNHQLLLQAKKIPYCNEKIGPGAPPVKTSRGWLHIFHAVYVHSGNRKNGWEDTWNKEYLAGILLLEKDNPYKIRGFSKKPLMVPEASYEVSEGFRNHVIFPGGIIVEQTGEVKIYYGAADTVECLAMGEVDELVNFVLSDTT